MKQLIKPEVGWTRYDDTNECFIYSKGFDRYGYPDATYMKGTTTDKDKGVSVIFYAYTDKIRILSDVYDYSNRARNLALYIDEEEYRININSNFLLKNVVIFEKEDLEMKIHKFELKIDSKSIINLGYKDVMMTFDAVDINSEGFLIQYNACVIKMDDVYYSFNENQYDIDNKEYKQISLEDIKSNKENTFSTPDKLIKEITIGDETFKPIDKFTGTKLALVSMIDFNLSVEENNHDEIVEQAIPFKSLLFDEIKLLTIGAKNIKLLISVNDGDLLFYNIETGIWEDSTISISDIESNKELFKEKGMDISTFDNANFNKLDKGDIKVYVLLLDKNSIIKHIDYTATDIDSEMIIEDKDINIKKYTNKVEIDTKEDINNFIVNIIPKSSSSSEGGTVIDEELTDQEIQNILDRIM